MTIKLEASTTALVLIDLQKGIASRPELAPHSGEHVVKRSIELAERFRRVSAGVVLVNVAFAPDFKDALKSPVDAPMQGGPRPANFSELVDGLQKPGDLTITKHQWGAFYGTELDLQLRRRGIQTIVLGGIATNIGVESTARLAYELGYHLVIVEDICSTYSAEMQHFAFNHIFPRISRIAKNAADVSLG